MIRLQTQKNALITHVRAPTQLVANLEQVKTLQSLPKEKKQDFYFLAKHYGSSHEKLATSYVNHFQRKIRDNRRRHQPEPGNDAHLSLPRCHIITKSDIFWTKEHSDRQEESYKTILTSSIQADASCSWLIQAISATR